MTKDELEKLRKRVTTRWYRGHNILWEMHLGGIIGWYPPDDSRENPKKWWVYVTPSFMGIHHSLYLDWSEIPEEILDAISGMEPQQRMEV